MEKVLAIIPARYASTRLPGKPLLDIGGKPMIQRVFDQVSKCSAVDEIVIATDDERISNVAMRFGAKALMTAPHHQSGTERCGEILQLMSNKYDLVINIQGDEPFIHPEQLEELLAAFKNPAVKVATLGKKISDSKAIEDPNVVKLVKSKSGKALYFSRSVIPFTRDSASGSFSLPTTYFQHIGLYAYKAETLLEIVTLQASDLEKSEQLEQLRWLENDIHIQVEETNYTSHGIDTPHDLEKARALFN